MTSVNFEVDDYSNRNKGLGGSDAAIALNLSPFKKPLQLWKEKTGRATPYDISKNPKVKMGHVLEPVIVKMYEDQKRFKVDADPGTVYHPKYPFMFGHADGLIADKKRILEVKTASNPKSWESGVPEHYRIQCMHYCMIYDYYEADVAVLINGSDFRIYRLNFTDADFQWLVEGELKFWNKVTSNDWGEPIEKTKPIETNDSEIIGFYNQLLDIKGKIKLLTTQKGDLEDCLKELMGSNDTLTNEAGDILATYKTQTANRFDTKAFKADNQNLYERYVKQVESKVLRFK